MTSNSKGPNCGSRQRRQFLKVVSTGAVMTGLAGCIDSGSNDGSGGDGSLEGPIKIGTLSPTKEQVYGVTIPNGARIAVEELNKNGGVLDKEIELVVKNTEGDAQTAKSKYRELALQDEVDLILGPLASESSINVMSEIASHQTVTMNPAASTERIIDQVNKDYDSYKYLFRVGHINSYHQAINMLDFAEQYFGEMGWDSVAYISEGRSWSETQHDVISDQLADVVDAEVTEILRYSGDTEDFTSIYDRIEESGADGMFASTAYKTVTAVSQWAKQQRPFGFVGNHTGLMPSMIYSALEGAAEYSASLSLGSVPGVEFTDRTGPFQETYSQKYDGYPSYPAYSSYDSVLMFAKAVEEANSLQPESTISKLESMVFDGSSGVIEFYGPDSDYRHDTMYGPDRVYPVWFQWQKQNGSGKQVPIWPEEYATSEYQKPSWIS